MRATFNYAAMRRVMRTVTLRIGSWTPRPGSGWLLSWQLVRLNALAFTAELSLAAVAAVLFYTPAYSLQRLVAYLEIDPGREEQRWGWVYAFGLTISTATVFLG